MFMSSMNVDEFYAWKQLEEERKQHILINHKVKI